jgi:two-component system, chemotaxis family, protein-glutamate methylesterase/glutaminase
MDAVGPAFDVICIGASAGGIEPLKQIARRLPAGFPAAVFVVLHVPESGTSVLPNILSRAGSLAASHARHGDPIRASHIYVAPPGFHLTVEAHRMRVVRGARENGHRPAIDPLFRSAALAFGARAVGVVLSGLLDDGTIGLKEIKRAGGTAIVQDPADTEWPAMPLSALANVEVDHALPAKDIGDLLVRLVGKPAAATPLEPDEAERAANELRNITMHMDEREKPGDPSPYSCPECGGVLWEMRDGELLRFRCRVGHAYTSDALGAEQADTVEKALWTALRALEEQSALRHRLAERARMNGHHARAQQFEERSRDLASQAQQVRELLLVGVGVARD